MIKGRVVAQIARQGPMPDQACIPPIGRFVGSDCDRGRSVRSLHQQPSAQDGGSAQKHAP
jgi:hypothetical protein